MFLNTKRVMSRATLDSGDKNMSLYEGMTDLYKDITDFNMIDVIDESQMIGFGVDDDAAMDFDQLNPLEFKECLDFILTHYREARNNKTRVGITSHLLITQTGSHISYIYIYSQQK